MKKTERRSWKWTMHISSTDTLSNSSHCERAWQPQLHLTRIRLAKDAEFRSLRRAAQQLTQTALGSIVVHNKHRGRVLAVGHATSACNRGE